LKHLYSFKDKKKEKTCFVVRYGGFGDALQASSILPWLKEDGYKVVFYLAPGAHEALMHDPHVDEFVVQDIDAIDNADLGEFWGYLEERCDRFINLSESVERSLLTMPGHMAYKWPQRVRHKYFNVNYFEMIHDIAGVPMPSRMRFYPTEEEVSWAKAEKERMGTAILWILSGSAIHKVWPYLDMAIDQIMLKQDGTNVVLVGDAGCKMLEQGWEDVPRVHCRSGVWTIRQTMAFAQVCDLVVGPETGVLNAVAFEPVPKIVMMSHSSVDNLTRDWMNCVSLTPQKTECYPCHQIHFNWDSCNQYGKSGIAKCQQDISLSRALYEIEKVIGQKHDRRPLSVAA